MYEKKFKSTDWMCNDLLCILIEQNNQRNKAIETHTVSGEETAGLWKAHIWTARAMVQIWPIIHHNPKQKERFCHSHLQLMFTMQRTGTTVFVIFISLFRILYTRFEIIFSCAGQVLMKRNLLNLLLSLWSKQKHVS